MRLKVAYVGMNPIDAMLRREPLDWMPVKYPFVPGVEHTGIVEAVGEGVDGAWLGRRVLSRVSFGGYAEASIAPAGALIRLDDRIDLRTGCAYRGCTFTAWHALHALGRIRSGEKILIHSAAGAVGLMAAQIAMEAGAHPIGLAGGKSKVAFAEQFGFPVIDYLQEAWPQKVRAANDGRLFDMIVDGNGGPNAEHNYQLIAPLGRVLYIGNSANAYPEPIPVPLLIGKSFSVGGFTLRQIEAAPGSDTEKWITDAVATGRWKVPISETVDLENVVDLHRRLERREVMGRAVIRVNPALR